MRKEIYNLKEKALYGLGLDVNVSKNGNKYVYLRNFSSERRYNVWNITKSTINKINTQDKFMIPQRDVLLLTKNGKTMVKMINEKHFRSMSYKDIYNIINYENIVSDKLSSIKDLFFIGKKCEWLKNYDVNMYGHYNFLRTFESEKKLLLFLGVTFKINKLNEKILYNLIAGYKFKNKNNLLNAEKNELEDTIKMIEQTNNQHFYNSNKKISNIHNEIIEIYNRENIENKSEEIIVPDFQKKFLEKLKVNLPECKITPLKCEKDLFVEGLKQRNCVGSRSYALKDNAFFHIKNKKDEYTIQLKKDRIHEIQKKYNNGYDNNFKNRISQILYPNNNSLLTSEGLNIDMAFEI